MGCGAADGRGAAQGDADVHGNSVPVVPARLGRGQPGHVRAGTRASQADSIQNLIFGYSKCKTLQIQHQDPFLFIYF